MATSTYTALATTTLSATASTVTFSSIPATYRDLAVSFNLQHDRSGNPAVIAAYLNAGGSLTRISAFSEHDGTVASGTGSDGSFIYPSPDQWVVGSLNLLDYSATDKHKTFLIRAGSPIYSVGVNTTATIMGAFRFADTSVVNSLTFYITTAGVNFKVGSTFSLFGIAS